MFVIDMDSCSNRLFRLCARMTSKVRTRLSLQQISTTRLSGQAGAGAGIESDSTLGCRVGFEPVKFWFESGGFCFWISDFC